MFPWIVVTNESVNMVDFKRRALKPRSRESVVNRNLDSDTDSGQQGVFPGNHFLNPKLKNVRLVSPGCYEGGRTVFRVWPMLDPEDPAGNILPGRLNAMGLAGLGGMSISEPVLVASFVGINKNSMLASKTTPPLPVSYIIAKDKTAVIEGIQFWDEPYVLLRKVAKAAKKAGEFATGRAWNPRWNSLFEDKNQALPAFKAMYFAIGHLLENGKDLNLEREVQRVYDNGTTTKVEVPRKGVPLGLADDDPLIVMAMSVSAGSSMLEMCVREKSSHTSTSTNPSDMFIAGDPCGTFNKEKGTIDGGVFFTIYNPKHHIFGGAEKPSKHTTFSGKLDEKAIAIRYEAGISRKMPSPLGGEITASMTPEQVEQIFKKNLYMWRDTPEDSDDSFLLHEPTIEERCVHLAKAFALTPKLLEFCWMSKPEYLEFDAVKAVMNARVSVLVPDKTADVDPDALDDNGEVASDSPAAPVAPVSNTAKTKTTSKTDAKPKPKASAALSASVAKLSKPKPKPVEVVDDLTDELLDEEAPFEADQEDDALDELDDLDSDGTQAAPTEVLDEFDDDDEFEDNADDNPVESVADDGEFEEVDAASDEFDDEKSDEPDEAPEPLAKSLAAAQAVARSSKRTAPNRSKGK